MRISVALAINLLVLLVVLTLGGIMGVYFIIEQTRTLNEDLDRRVNLVGKHLSRQLEINIDQKDIEEQKLALNDAASVKDIAYITLKSVDGRILAARWSSKVNGEIKEQNFPIHALAHDTKNNGETFFGEQTEKTKGQTIGLLSIGISLSPLRTTEQRLIWRTVGSVVISATLTMLLGFFVVRLLLNRSISPLISGIRELGAGDISCRVNSNLPGEIGDICRAFNKMADQLSDTMISKDNLESIVDERTMEIREVEEVLRASDERLNLALSATRLGVWEWNVQTNEIFWSPECFAIFRVENFSGTLESFTNILHPDDVYELYDKVNQAMVEKSDYFMDFRIIDSDKQVYWMLNHARFTYDENGKPLRLIGTVQDITERKRAEDALLESEAELKRNLETIRKLSIHMEEIRETERTNIAREIHDELGQMLTVLHFDLQYLKDRLPDSETKCILKVEEMNEHISSTIESVHKILAELRPRVLDDLGLVPAMKWQANEFEKWTGIRCQFKPKDSMEYITGSYATAIFRIFQESLVNIARHANATMVKTSFTETEGQLFLKISDNGIGITPVQLNSEHSFGLMGIRERVKMCGGELDITGQEGKGTTILVSIPVPEKEKLGNEDTIS